MQLSLGHTGKMLVTYLRPHWIRALALAFLLISNIVLQLVGPLILGRFIDAARAQWGVEQLLQLASLFLGIAFMTQVVSVIEAYMAEDVAWLTTNTLRTDLTRHCLRLDMTFHNTYSPGELTQRIDGDISALANFFSRFIITILGHGLLLLGMVIVLYFVDWRIGFPITLFVCFALWLFSFIRKFVAGTWEEALQLRAKLFGFIEERLSGAEDIRTSGAIENALHRLYTLLRQRLHVERRAGVRGTLMWGTSTFLMAVGTALAFGLSALLVMRGAITLGAAYLIFTYTQRLVWPLDQLSGQLQDFQQALAGLNRLRQLLEEQPSLHEGSETLLPAAPLSIEFDHVTFGYAPETPVLSDLSFRVQPGETLAILGRTGSGKTTMARLLFRLYDVNQGSIRVGEKDIRTLKTATLRRSIAFVTQDVQLFHAPIRGNVTLFDRSISDAQILNAFKKLGLWDWYLTQPQGLETILQAGRGLSAGQAQLLAFTRVFLRNPSIVVLDEASARLDPVTEHLLEQAIDTLLCNRTGIIIAHRLSTVHRADKILVLANGKIVEYGFKEHLLSDDQSLYRKLLQASMEGDVV
jgi:ATP-binding cassette, subfamily B, bacterial